MKKKSQLPSLTAEDAGGVTDEEDNPNDDMEDGPQIHKDDVGEDEVDSNCNTSPEPVETNDELAGQAKVEFTAVPCTFEQSTVRCGS